MKEFSELTYQAAYNEIEQIIHSMKASNISVEDMAAKVERAYALIDYCRDKLITVEAAIDTEQEPGENGR
jgi:exodeoxyribonuclease VII small subunit